MAVVNDFALAAVMRPSIRSAYIAGVDGSMWWIIGSDLDWKNHPVRVKNEGIEGMVATLQPQTVQNELYPGSKLLNVRPGDLSGTVAFVADRSYRATVYDDFKQAFSPHEPAMLWVDTFDKGWLGLAVWLQAPAPIIPFKIKHRYLEFELSFTGYNGVWQFGDIILHGTGTSRGKMFEFTNYSSIVTSFKVNLPRITNGQTIYFYVDNVKVGEFVANATLNSPVTIYLGGAGGAYVEAVDGGRTSVNLTQGLSLRSPINIYPGETAQLEVATSVVYEVTAAMGFTGI